MINFSKKYPITLTIDLLKEMSNELRTNENEYTPSLAFSNGCFDILHVGHTEYLKKASEIADILVVGINSDRSAKENKNDKRPINNEICRMQIISSLKYVNHVILFDEKTPINILKEIKPEYFIKGGDYTLDTLDQNERKTVESYGGKIKLIKIETDISTTQIINKIKDVFK